MKTKATNTGEIKMCQKMFRAARWGLALVLWFGLAAAVAAAEKAAGKGAEEMASGNSWTRFNAGAFAESRSISVTKSDGKMETNIMTSRITLLKKSADHFTLETKVTVKGQTITNVCEFEVKGYPEDEQDPPDLKILKRSQETLTIAGKSVVCEVVDAVLDLGGSKCHFKRWTSRQVPGLLVQNVILDESSPSRMETVDFATSGPAGARK
jgi:hypothetical protein